MNTLKPGDMTSTEQGTRYLSCGGSVEYEHDLSATLSMSVTENNERSFTNPIPDRHESLHIDVLLYMSNVYLFCAPWNHE